MLGKRSHEELDESSLKSYLSEGAKKVITWLTPSISKKKLIEMTAPVNNEDESLSINYLWVGPPSINNKRFKYHDIAGPIAMSKQLNIQKDFDGQTYPITFWCLSKHTEYYKKIFQQYEAKIEVESIEDHLSLEHIEDNASIRESANQLLKYIENIRETDSIRSHVTAKDGFSLFLLVSRPGYIMDTNVFPAQKENENQYCTVKLSKHEKVSTAVVYGGCSPHDFYLMYSPEKGLPLTIKLFQAWIQKIQIGNIGVFNSFKLEMGLLCNTNYTLGVQKHSYKSYGGIYDSGCDINIFSHLNPFNWGQFSAHLQFTDVNQRIGDSAKSTLSSSGGVTFVTSFLGDKNLFDTWYQNNISTESAFIFKINFCSFRNYHSKTAKDGEIYYYNNSKKEFTLIANKLQYFDQNDYFFCETFNESEKLPSIKSTPIELMESKFSDFLRFIMNSHSENLHCIPYITGHQDETLLHGAINLNLLSAVELLLKKNIDLNLKATYTIMPEGTVFTFTPYELAIFLKREKIIALLENRQNLIEESRLAHSSVLVPQYNMNTQTVLPQSIKNDEAIISNENNESDRCSKIQL
ncbi:MAG: hypothetical protein U1E78_08945 [Gammaproteobacteria bacterium]